MVVHTENIVFQTGSCYASMGDIKLALMSMALQLCLVWSDVSFPLDNVFCSWLRSTTSPFGGSCVPDCSHDIWLWCYTRDPVDTVPRCVTLFFHLRCVRTSDEVSAPHPRRLHLVSPRLLPQVLRLPTRGESKVSLPLTGCCRTATMLSRSRCLTRSFGRSLSALRQVGNGRAKHRRCQS